MASIYKHSSQFLLLSLLFSLDKLSKTGRIQLFSLIRIVKKHKSKKWLKSHNQ